MRPTLRDCPLGVWRCCTAYRDSYGGFHKEFTGLAPIGNDKIGGAPCFSTSLMTAPSKTHVDTILREKYPLQMLTDVVVSSSGYQQLTAGSPDTAPATIGRDKAMVGYYELKAQLEAMPAPEVARLAAASMARQQAKHQAKLKADAEAKEAARFYNRPDAMADFAYWCKVEFWTLDEAVALLLGRDPQVVTPEALTAELSRPTGFFNLGAAPGKAAFHIAHERLRTLMLRAEALASPRLKPSHVLAWATGSGAVEVPPALAQFITNDDPPAQAAGNPDAADTPRTRQWTQDELAEMRRYKDRNGTKATAEKYGVSEARIRKLAPTVVEPPSALKGLESWTRNKL